MQTQKSPNDPHIKILACGCKFHHFLPIPHFKILLDISIHWNRRPLTIWRFCWQPFWKWWPRINDPECKFHHYQPIPHFKILLDINFHWNRRPLTICRFCWQPFWKCWPHINDLECKGVGMIRVDDFTLSFVALQCKWRRVQLIIGNSNMVVLFYISCSLFHKMLYSVHVHSKNNIPILYDSI